MPVFSDELEEELRRPAFDHAVPAEDDRPLGGVDHRRGALDVAPASRGARGDSRGGAPGPRVPHERRARLLRVLGDVDEHRARPPRAGDVEGLAQGRRDVVDLA